MTSMRRFGIILASVSLAATAAFAQSNEPVSALKGHDINAPVDAFADRVEVQSRADRVVFSGNVQVRQGGLTLNAPRVTIAYANEGGLQIKRIDAAGGVLVQSPSETARGSFGVYDTDRKLITLIGDVQLDRGQNRLHGSRLVIDLNSGRATMDGGPPGIGQKGGRVTGHFTVPQRNR